MTPRNPDVARAKLHEALKALLRPALGAIEARPPLFSHRAWLYDGSEGSEGKDDEHAHGRKLVGGVALGGMQSVPLSFQGLASASAGSGLGSGSGSVSESASGPSVQGSLFSLARDTNTVLCDAAAANAEFARCAVWLLAQFCSAKVLE
jgi:hypothetical protein